MGLADSFPRLRPRPLDEKRSNSSRLGESTPETRLVQVRILLPQPATRPRRSPWRGAPQNGGMSAHFRTPPTLQALESAGEPTLRRPIRRIFSGRPDGSVGSGIRAAPPSRQDFTRRRAAAASLAANCQSAIRRLRHAAAVGHRETPRPMAAQEKPIA
jgi:hypothetical protein